MNFCFVVDGLLAASSQPGKNKRITYYLDLYKENNIKVLISLHKKLILPSEYKNKFQSYFFFIDEYESPSVELLDKIVNTIIKHLKKKEAVNVNCAAGISNSGMVLIATIMKFMEKSYNEAFKIVSEHRYALDEPERTYILQKYENFLKELKKPAKKK